MAGFATRAPREGPSAPAPAQNRVAASRLAAQALLRDLGEDGIVHMASV